jgi:hypothetical protein
MKRASSPHSCDSVRARAAQGQWDEGCGCDYVYFSIRLGRKQGMYHPSEPWDVTACLRLRLM